MSAQFGDDFADDIRNTEAAREDESVEDVAFTRRRKKSAGMEDGKGANDPTQEDSAPSPPPTAAISGSSTPHPDTNAEGSEVSGAPESAAGSVTSPARAEQLQASADTATSMALDDDAVKRKNAKEDWIIDLDNLDFSDPAAAQRQGEYNQRMLETMRYQMLLAVVMSEPSKAEALVKTLDKRARAQGADSEAFIREVTSAENVTATIQELYPELNQALRHHIDLQEAGVRDAFSSAGLDASPEDIRKFCVVAAYQDLFPPAHGMGFREQIQKMAGPIGKALTNPNVQVALGTIAVTLATGGVGTAFAAAGLARSLVNHPRMESINSKLFEMAQRHAPASIVSATKAIQDTTKDALNSKAFSWLSKGRIAAGIVMGVAFVALGGVDKAPDLFKSAAEALEAGGGMGSAGVGAIADTADILDAADPAGVDAAAGGNVGGAGISEPSSWSDLASHYGAFESRVNDALDSVYSLVNEAMDAGHSAGLDAEIALADQPPSALPDGFTQSGGEIGYTVSTEDSQRGLWGIADRYLESQGIENPTDTQIANMVNDIVDANATAHPDLMTNRDLIHPGQSLVMPVSPEGMASSAPTTSPLPKVDMSSISSLADAQAPDDESVLAVVPFKKGATAPSM
jgi:hypothetical protein